MIRIAILFFIASVSASNFVYYYKFKTEQNFKRKDCLKQCDESDQCKSFTFQNDGKITECNFFTLKETTENIAPKLTIAMRKKQVSEFQPYYVATCK